MLLAFGLLAEKTLRLLMWKCA